MVFLTETKIDAKRMEVMRRRFGFLNGIDIGAKGSKGGLCLAWREDIQVSLRSFSSNYINVLLQLSSKEVKWRFICFYGSLYAFNKSTTWECLRHLGNNNDIPWCVCRDFNEILYAHEKKGCLPRKERRMASFQ